MDQFHHRTLTFSYNYLSDLLIMNFLTVFNLVKLVALRPTLGLGNRAGTWGRKILNK